jgi:hypothetical protein
MNDRSLQPRKPPVHFPGRGSHDEQNKGPFRVGGRHNIEEPARYVFIDRGVSSIGGEDEGEIGDIALV